MDAGFAPDASGPKPGRIRPDVEPHLDLRTWRTPGGNRWACVDTASYRVTAGRPDVPDGEMARCLAAFEADCGARGLRPLCFGLSAADLEHADPDARRGRWHVGDLPVFDLGRWLWSQDVPRGIRAQARRAMHHGIFVRHLSAPPADPGPLRDCLRSWLRRKPLPPLRFITQPFLLDPWPPRGVFVAEDRGGRVQAFLVTSQSLYRDMIRVDAIVRHPRAPNGCAELLVTAAFHQAAEQGWTRATLGLVPLAKRSGARSDGYWDEAARFWRGVMRPLYSFGGLEAFKAKFKPDEWRPLFCVSAGNRFSLRDALAMQRAFAGGSLSRYGVRAILWKMGVRILGK